MCLPWRERSFLKFGSLRPPSFLGFHAADVRSFLQGSVHWLTSQVRRHPSGCDSGALRGASGTTCVLGTKKSGGRCRLLQLQDLAPTTRVSTELQESLGSTLYTSPNKKTHYKKSGERPLLTDYKSFNRLQEFQQNYKSFNRTKRVPMQPYASLYNSVQFYAILCTVLYPMQSYISYISYVSDIS